MESTTTKCLRFKSSLLLLRRCLLRSLQRVLRCGTGEPATLTRRSLGLGDKNVSITRAGDCTLNQKEVVLKIDTADAEIADRDLRVTHVARHTLSGEYTRRERR